MEIAAKVILSDLLSPLPNALGRGFGGGDYDKYTLHHLMYSYYGGKGLLFENFCAKISAYEINSPHLFYLFL